MADQHQVKMLLSDGVAAWNQWRKENPDIEPVLSGANLSGANLRRANLRGANLCGTNLKGANLRRADLYEALFVESELSGANLREAILFEVDLCEVDLRGADLRRAQLPHASLYDAVLDDADLRQAALENADLQFAHLRGANLSGASLMGADLTWADLTAANLSEAGLIGANLSNANLTLADLTAADLTRASCLQTNFSGSTLTECIVYGIAAWDLNLDGAVQANLHISPLRGEGGITVDNLEVAQFLYLLLHNEKMRAVLDTITSKVVLILGRFSSERKPVLDALREALRRHPNGYIPVLFDFQQQTERHVLDTVKTLANLARFVIADVTDARVVRSELMLIVPTSPALPVQPIVQRDAALPLEYDWFRQYPWVQPVYAYADLADLLVNLTESVIEAVEAHVEARRL